MRYVSTPQPDAFEAGEEIMNKLITIVAIPVIVAGCVTDVANRYYLTEKFPPKAPAEVSILYSKPARPFNVIADFQSRGESATSLQQQAAEIGADAIIVSSFGGTYSFGERWAGSDKYSGSGSRVVGTAIRFK